MIIEKINYVEQTEPC